VTFGLAFARGDLGEGGNTVLDEIIDPGPFGGSQTARSSWCVSASLVRIPGEQEG
jgi:hypothetical protein